MQNLVARFKPNRKKTFSILVSVAMVVCLLISSAVPASAAWISDDFNLDPGGHNRGADRYYDGNYMAYEIEVTDASGSDFNSAIIMVQLRSYSSPYVLSEEQIEISDGRVKIDWIRIMDGGCYYFEYWSVSTGTGAKEVNIDMTMYSWYA